MSETAFAATFRAEWPQLVAVLVRDLGDLDLAEDAAQDAFAEAARVWPTMAEPPRSPGAWLTTVARRKAIDRVRRMRSYESKLQQLEASARSGSSRRTSVGLVDEQLALLLGCCHPVLDTAGQVALTLRVVAGLSTQQIARAFLVSEAAMSKRLTRAKARIRDEKGPFGPVDRADLEVRLGAVLQVIYLIFTEGHSSASDEELVRGDLCDEAAWLASLVAHLVPSSSEALGLAALVLLTDARRGTRLDGEGLPVLLEDQDRSLWNREKIAAGLDYLLAASRRGDLGTFGLQAAVASFHATAPAFEDTNWPAVLGTYDRMLAVADSPVIRLNRAVAKSYVSGPAVALSEIDELVDHLDSYVYFHSARAELLSRLGRHEEARSAYEEALGCEPALAQRTFLERRLSALDR